MDQSFLGPRAHGLGKPGSEVRGKLPSGGGLPAVHSFPEALWGPSFLVTAPANHQGPSLMLLQGHEDPHSLVQRLAVPGHLALSLFTCHPAFLGGFSTGRGLDLFRQERPRLSLPFNT